MASTDERREKLPMWARQELSRLERDLNYAKERLGEGPANSRVFADPYSDPPRPLGHDTSIEFRLGDKWGEKINVRIDKGGIQVMGGTTLAVFPKSSNVVYIEATEGP